MKHLLILAVAAFALSIGHYIGAFDATHSEAPNGPRPGNAAPGADSVSVSVSDGAAVRGVPDSGSIALLGAGLIAVVLMRPRHPV